MRKPVNSKTSAKATFLSPDYHDQLFPAPDKLTSCSYEAVQTFAMSDFGDDRPSKRRRRNSVSTSPPPRIERDGYTRRRDRSPIYKEQRRKNSRDRDPRPERERDLDRTVDLSKGEDRDRDRERRDRGERRRRSGSRERYHDSEARSHRTRDRSSSPRSSRHRHRHRDKDSYRDDRSREKHSRRKDRSHKSPSPKPFERSKRPLPSQNDAFVATTDPASGLENGIEKQKPNFGLTGKLAAASNTVQTSNQTIVLKYHEPPESRKPPTKDRWRLYVFKGDEILDTVELSEQSCWLFGREVAVADFPLEHQSCSKQHAVIQFRYLEKRNEFGDKIGKVKPYVIDLESANGTILNEEPVPAAKYVELRDKDVLKFGHSSRDYVIQLPPSK